MFSLTLYEFLTHVLTNNNLCINKKLDMLTTKRHFRVTSDLKETKEKKVVTIYQRDKVGFTYMSVVFGSPWQSTELTKTDGRRVHTVRCPKPVPSQSRFIFSEQFLQCGWPVGISSCYSIIRYLHMTTSGMTLFISPAYNESLLD